MFRRTVMLTLLLALILGLVLPAVPASAVSPSQETAMRSALQSQFDAYAQELNYTDVHEDAIKQLLNHALKGKGKPLNMDTGDPFVRSILNASLFRDAFVQTVMSSIQLLQDYRDDRNLLIGGVAWYDHDLRYSAGLYKYNSTADQADDVRIGYNNVKQEALSRPINANDKAMILVAGDVYYQTRLTHIQATDTEVTYRVHLTLSDTFNFDRDYSTEAGKGYDTSTAELITLVGKMMSFGLVDSFTWQFSTELQITVPNYCDHSSGDYRWELQGSNLASVTDGGFTANALTRIDEKNVGN